MANPTPVAGVTHDLVLEYGAPGATSKIGLMVAGGLARYSKQPYSAFAPQLRQGEATNRDYSIAAVWELNNDWSLGTAHLVEPLAETPSYAFALGGNFLGSTGPTLLTHKPGAILPPVAATVATNLGNVKQFIIFKSTMFALTNDAAGKVYEYSSATAATLKETLTASGKIMVTNGSTLFVAQGGSNPVRITTAVGPSSWSNHTFNADCLAIRDNGVLAYVSGATLHPQGTEGYANKLIGWSGTTATNMVYWLGSLWVAKPEGLWRWTQGNLEQKILVQEMYDTSNFTAMCVHNNVLFFNIKNKLFFSDGNSFKEIYPTDVGGFQTIQSLSSTTGGVLLCAKIQDRWYLFLFQLARQGLNPLWSDLAGVSTLNAAFGTTNFDSTGVQIYLSQLGIGEAYLNFGTNYLPKTYTPSATDVYLQLTEFTAGFRNIPKWGYEYILNVRNPNTTTFAQVFYNLDGSAYSGVQTKTPGTLADDASVGTVAWTNPGNAAASDDAYATAALTVGTETTHYLKVTNFGFTIPTGATIRGIEVSVESALTSGTGPVQYETVKLVVGGSVTGTNVAQDYIGNPLVDVFGSAYQVQADWGTTPTVAQVNASNFGVVVSVTGLGGATTAGIDQIFVTVFYDVGTWTQTVDQNGAAHTLTLSSRSVGTYLPLNTTFTNIATRIYLYTTDANNAAEISHVTLRGAVMVKPRYQFGFPVDASDTLINKAGVTEKGDAIRSALQTASQQGYPCNLYDPDGSVWLVLFRPPSPYDITVGSINPTGNVVTRRESQIQMLLVEVDPLTSTGGLNAWTAG